MGRFQPSVRNPYCTQQGLVKHCNFLENLLRLRAQNPRSFRCFTEIPVRSSYCRTILSYTYNSTGVDKFVKVLFLRRKRTWGPCLHCRNPCQCRTRM
jgi:hypothetical protein